MNTGPSQRRYVGRDTCRLVSDVSWCLTVRVLTSVMLCSVVILAGGWMEGGALTPPNCLSAGSAAVETGWLPGHQVESVSVPVPMTRDAQPTYTRMCGPAKALARFHGTLFRIRGGRCGNPSRGFELSVGLTAAAPAASGKSLRLLLSDQRATTHAGTFKFAEEPNGSGYVTLQLPKQPGLGVSSGTITIGKSRRDGTFVLRLHDGARVTGSWTCD